MRRLTVSFTDEQFEWIQDQADERDRPKKWVIQKAVDAARGKESTYSDVVPPGDTNTDRVAPGDTGTHQRLDELEQRLEDLAAQLQEDPEDDDVLDATAVASGEARPSSERPQSTTAPEENGATHTSSRDDADEQASDAPLDDRLREWRPGRSSDEREERLDSARAVIEYIQERGSATKDDLVEDVYPEQGVDGQSERTWWRKTARGQLDEGTGGALAIATAAGRVERQQGPPHVYRWVE